MRRLGQSFDLGNWGTVDFTASNQLKNVMTDKIIDTASTLGLDWLFPKTEAEKAVAKAAAPVAGIDPKYFLIGGFALAAILIVVLARKKRR